MKKFVLLFILILPVGCAATSTEQLEPADPVGTAPAATQQFQRILDGQSTFQKPPASVPETLEGKRPIHVEKLKSPNLAGRISKRSSSKQKPWQSMWFTPMKRSSPLIAEKTSPQAVKKPPPASWDSYKKVEFGKFASGSYVFDYANEYVSFKCTFTSIGTEFVEYAKYPRPEYITFNITGVNSRLHHISVVVPRLNSDELFKLKPEREIALYGKAVMIDMYTLTLEVIKIER